MKNDQYFKHDVSASSNRKLIILLLQEGARGYGVYWFLLEMLRKHADFRLPLNFLGAVAGMCHTHRKVVERVVREYDLFRVEGDYFYSPGMNKRMGRFVAKIFKSSPNATPNSEDNSPKKSELPLLSARVEEKSREEQSRAEQRIATKRARLLLLLLLLLLKSKRLLPRSKRLHSTPFALGNRSPTRWRPTPSGWNS